MSHRHRPRWDWEQTARLMIAAANAAASLFDALHRFR